MENTDTTNNIATILLSLEDAIVPFTTCEILAEGAFIGCLKSALAKSYGINRIIADQQTPTNAFSLTASLRGLCEDIIFLRYVAKFKEKRDEIVIELLMHNMGRYIDKQRVFFESYRPGQLVFLPQLGQQDTEWKRRLKNIGFDTNTNIETMAQQVGLKALYDYLYAATSASVHFSPYTLMRMGWGADKKTFHYSTDEFSGYYFHFNRIYGTLLFIVFCTRFASLLGAKEVLKPSVDGLVDVLSNEVRWPEIITPEEMNQRKPSEIIYLLAHSAYRVSGKEASVLWTWADEEE